MMTKEQTFIITLISDYVNNRRTCVPEDIDFRILNQYAKIHQIGGIVYTQCNETRSSLGDLKSTYAFLLYSYYQRMAAIKEFESILEKNHYDFVFFKGMEIAKLYTDPQLRSMGDVDVLVNVEEREAICELLYSHEFVLDHKEDNKFGTWHLKKNGIEFEIHCQLIYEGYKQDTMYQYFMAPWIYKQGHSFVWEFHFIYLLAHLKEHLIENGVGLRQFMDLAVVINHVNLDWKQIKTQVNNLGLAGFFNHVVILLKAWFGVVIPEYPVIVDEEFVSLVTEKILNDGVFGYGDKENRNNSTMIQIHKKGKVFAMKRFSKAVFLPYQKMIRMNEYSFLRGKPFLLPIAWIYRVIIKWKHRRDIGKQYMISDDRIDARMAYLKEWGL